MALLYTWVTPTGRNISLLLEEFGLTGAVVAVKSGCRGQSSADSLVLSPNGRIPVLADKKAAIAPVYHFGGGTVLTSFAEKSRRFRSAACAGCYAMVSCLHWQTARLVAAMTQFLYFARLANEKILFAIARILQGTTRVLEIMELRLAETSYVAGERYSIADIASYSWGAVAPNLKRDLLDDKPALRRWLKQVGQRPAVIRGMTVPNLPKAGL